MKRREFLSYAAAAPAAAYAGVACTETKTGEQATSGTHDLVLKNGRILDGSGSPWFNADIALKNGRISKVGRVDEEKADRIIDVEGLFVSPGFIDIHNHSDTSKSTGLRATPQQSCEDHEMSDQQQRHEKCRYVPGRPEVWCHIQMSERIQKVDRADNVEEPDQRRRPAPARPKGDERN